MKLLRTTTTGLLSALVFVVSACSGTPTGDPEQTTINVFAAASLTNAFTELASEFEAENPDLRIQLNLAGSSSLRSQILDGAPADVFASASEQIMAQVIDGGVIAGPSETFATNRLTIAVPTGNPGMVAGLVDFERADLFIGLCNAEVPCGALAAEDLAAAGITPAVDSFEPDVRALLTKIGAGELDAGLVYATDVLVEESVLAIDPFLADGSAAGFAATTYPIATVEDGPAGAEADRFVDFVLSPAGQDILAEFGFGAP